MPKKGIRPRWVLGNRKMFLYMPNYINWKSNFFHNLQGYRRSKIELLPKFVIKGASNVLSFRIGLYPKYRVPLSFAGGGVDDGGGECSPRGRRGRGQACGVGGHGQGPQGDTLLPRPHSGEQLHFLFQTVVIIFYMHISV